MRLELADFLVEEVRLGKKSCYHAGVLEINKEELLALILEDKRVKSAELDVAFPGEQTRIVKVRDAVEPRVKVSGPGCVFPGILGPVETVGEGRTHRLSGVTVLPSAAYHPTITSGTSAPSAGIVDMWGPGAWVTPFGSTINIVPVFTLADGLTEWEAHLAIQLAELKVARHLAETTRNATPHNIEVLEQGRVDSSLPRVVYILTYFTMWESPHPGMAYYGLPIRESLPTFIHPNELFDGVLTVDTRRGGATKTTTWDLMSQPMVFELFKQHGKQLDFLGIVLQRACSETVFGKQVTAAGAAQMARLLGADGAIITRNNVAGLSFIDVVLTVQACEQKGIKTVFVTPEWGGKDGNDMPLAFYVPEVTAMVSTGSFERDIKVPAPSKVIGAREAELVQVFAGDKPFSPWSELTLPSSYMMTGGVDYFGGMKLTCRDY